MDALDALRLQIEWGADDAWADAPVGWFAREAANATITPPVNADSRPPPPGFPTPQPALSGTPAARAKYVADRADTVEALRAALAEFDGCPLRDTATQLVFSDGNAGAGLVIVAEAPDADEDRAGLPMVGAAGQFFGRMLASAGIDQRAYLATCLIPWRPPGDRQPNDVEVATCLPFLMRHLALLRPRHVVLLGGLVTAAVTSNNAGIRRLRGRWVNVALPESNSGPGLTVPMLPMFHPASLRNTPAAKRDSWQDVLTLHTTRALADADSINQLG